MSPPDKTDLILPAKPGLPLPPKGTFVFDPAHVPPGMTMEQYIDWFHQYRKAARGLPERERRELQRAALLKLKRKPQKLQRLTGFEVMDAKADAFGKRLLGGIAFGATLALALYCAKRFGSKPSFGDLKDLYPEADFLVADDFDEFPKARLQWCNCKTSLQIDRTGGYAYSHGFRINRVSGNNDWTCRFSMFYPIPPPSRRFVSVFFFTRAFRPESIAMFSTSLRFLLPHGQVFSGFSWSLHHAPFEFNWLRPGGTTGTAAPGARASYPLYHTASGWSVDLLEERYYEQYAFQCDPHWPWIDYMYTTIRPKDYGFLDLNWWIPHDADPAIYLDMVYVWQHGPFMADITAPDDPWFHWWNFAKLYSSYYDPQWEKWIYDPATDEHYLSGDYIYPQYNAYLLQQAEDMNLNIHHPARNGQEAEEYELDVIEGEQP